MNKYITFASIDLSDEFDEAQRVLQDIMKDKILVTFPLSVSWCNKNFKISNRNELLILSVVVETANNKLNSYIDELIETTELVEDCTNSLIFEKENKNYPIYDDFV